ncbi:MAG: hypothetical protein NY202_05150 [Mollicutes bacterium UO1]
MNLLVPAVGEKKKNTTDTLWREAKNTALWNAEIKEKRKKIARSSVAETLEFLILANSLLE